ncbi:MAG TPA: amidohydrolase family protein [Thermoanaerobaculia bacterium]|nr:amidohydrolase family protein [Thermoanaerobaculia bacterium]
MTGPLAGEAGTGGLAIMGGSAVALNPPSVERRDVVLGSGPRRELDASGCLVLPGLAIAHTHLYSALARGMPGPAAPPRSFREILETVWWRLDAALDERSLEASAELALLDAALSGVTAVIDHHESPSFIEGSLDVLFRAARTIGVEIAPCYGATDRHGSKGARAGVAESARAIREGLPAMVGLHAGFTVSDETLGAATDLAKRTDAWLHVHAAEDRCDTGSFARLEKAGGLGPKTILAHGVHLSAAERRRAEEAGAWIVHNPRSNLQNAVGYADPRTLGPRVALGTDGMDADLFTEARVAHLRAREAYGPEGGIDAVALLANGRRLAGLVFGERSGDWIVLDYDPPTPLAAANLAGHVLFGLGSRHVRDVVVNGEIVVRDRRPVRADAARIRARAREEADRLWKRMA